MEQRSHFFENFHYPKPQALSFPQKCKRRGQQFSRLLFSSSYKNLESLNQGVLNHYSLKEEIDFYSQYSSFGLHPNELEALTHLSPSHSSCLVVGCGVGREALFLSQNSRLKEVSAIDNNPKMIEAAKQKHGHSDVKFILGDIAKLNETYDLIWITSILESHIQGSKNRIQLFKDLKRLSHKNSQLIFTPQIKKLHWRSLYFWSSQLLRLRWLGQNLWEKGDVVLANLGAHHKVESPIYSHFYPSENHFINELQTAGFTDFKKLPQGSWIIS